MADIKNDKAKKVAVIGGAVVVGIWLLSKLKAKQAPAVEVVEEEAGTNLDYYAPYYGGVPGAAEMSPGFNFNGGDTSIFLNNPALAMLHDKYIPIFGFVGVSAYGGN